MRDLRPRDLTDTLPYEGLRVGRLWLDQGLALELHPSRPPAENGAVVRLLWKPFGFVDSKGGSYRLVPHEHAKLLPIFGLIGAHVTKARVSESGDLHLAFDDGARVEAVGLEEGWEYASLPQRSGPVEGHS